MAWGYIDPEDLKKKEIKIFTTILSRINFSSESGAKSSNKRTFRYHVFNSKTMKPFESTKDFMIRDKNYILLN